MSAAKLTPQQRAAQSLFRVAPQVVRAVGCGSSNREFGLTFQQIRTLMYVADCPRCLGDIARERSVSAASASVLVDGLEQDGFVTRATDKVDGRRIIVRLTDKGTQAYEAIRAMGEGSLTEMVDCLTDDEAEALATILAKVRERTAG